MKQDEKISKALSYWLRHAPEAGNLILDKTDQEPRTYIIKLNRQRSILSVNILQAQQGMLCRLWSDGQPDISLNRVNDSHYFADLVPGVLVDTEPGALDALLKLEAAAAELPAFHSVATQLHVLGETSGATGA